MGAWHCCSGKRAVARSHNKSWAQDIYHIAQAGIVVSWTDRFWSAHCWCTNPMMTYNRCASTRHTQQTFGNMYRKSVSHCTRFMRHTRMVQAYAACSCFKRNYSETLLDAPGRHACAAILALRSKLMVSCSPDSKDVAAVPQGCTCIL